jgi:hypothetical protein
MIKYKTFIIKTFDQLKNDNFDQVKFDQVSVSLMLKYNLSIGQLSFYKEKSFVWNILTYLNTSAIPKYKVSIGQFSFYEEFC